MYIRKSSRTYNGKIYTNFVLVESVVTPKGPRQKTICSLGDLSPRPRQEWLKLARKIEDALVGQDDLLDRDATEVAEIVARVQARRTNETHAQAEPSASATRMRPGALIGVDPSRVTTEQHREAGPVHVGHQFWQRLGLDQILRDCGLSEATCRLACAMTLNRLIAPVSEHAMPAWIRRTALADILGVSFDALEEDPLYQVLDKLYPHRTAIEAALIERERSLFNLDQTIYLYDLTSTYFEPKRNARSSIASFFNGWRSTLGTRPATSQLDWHPAGQRLGPKRIVRELPQIPRARVNSRAGAWIETSIRARKLSVCESWLCQQSRRLVSIWSCRRLGR